MEERPPAGETNLGRASCLECGARKASRLRFVSLAGGSPSFFREFHRNYLFVSMCVELKQSANLIKNTMYKLFIYLATEGGGMVLTATNSSTVFGLDSFSQP